MIAAGICSFGRNLIRKMLCQWKRSRKNTARATSTFPTGHGTFRVRACMTHAFLSWGIWICKSVSDNAIPHLQIWEEIPHDLSPVLGPSRSVSDRTRGLRGHHLYILCVRSRGGRSIRREAKVGRSAFGMGPVLERSNHGIVFVRRGLSQRSLCIHFQT